ncbi:hypothetical protein ANANG_G00171740 [Anguilla anguilla]|uniref:Uncharacterized protein n=1 Tax=Anguilla anguilla TaxID=7936 RepID=A0A9D3M5A3_ANGAN|nr:hypothetical protein ANANG_G00171740 [Anguilla anguilla]
MLLLLRSYPQLFENYCQLISTWDSLKGEKGGVHPKMKLRYVSTYPEYYLPTKKVCGDLTTFLDNSTATSLSKYIASYSNIQSLICARFHQAQFLRPKNDNRVYICAKSQPKHGGTVSVCSPNTGKRVRIFKPWVLLADFQRCFTFTYTETTTVVVCRQASMKLEW